MSLRTLLVKLDGGEVRVHVCTETQRACEAGITKARTPIAEIAGVKRVDVCTFEP